MQLEVCANCEEVIDHAPVYTDGQSYCCTGCGAGGPCSCTYLDEPVAPERTIGAPAPAAASAPLLRFPRPNDVLVIVQLSGFADQRDVIEFAHSIETSPALANLTLACIADGDAWLTVQASSADTVAAVMAERSNSTRLDIIVNQNLVEARAVAEPTSDVAVGRPLVGESSPARPSGADLYESPREPWPSYEDRMDEGSSDSFEVVALPAPTDEHDRESVLPPRPRFRVFRPTAPSTAEQESDLNADTPTSLADDDEESRPDQIDYYIVATRPFRAFSAVNGYHEAIRALEGVKSTHVQRFDHGTLYLAVSYQSRVPLRVRLESIEGYTLDVVNETSSKIDVALRGVPPVTRASSSLMGRGLS